MKVILHKVSNKLAYYLRTKENDILSALLDDLLKIEEREVPFYCVIATKKEVTRKEYTRKFQFDDYYGYVPISMIELINYRLKNYDLELELETEVDKPNLDVTEDLERDLRPVYGENADKLIDLLKKISIHRSGLVDLPTGFGKTWSILGLAKIFLTNNPGRLLIIAQGSAVVNEIKGRMQLFNLPSNRVEIINSASVRSKRFYSEDYKKVMEETPFIIIDECDSIVNTMVDFLNYHTGYKSIVGFTATSDYTKGQKLNLDLNFSTLKSDVYRILAYVGHEIVTAVPEDNINLKVVYCHFSDKTPFMKSEFIKFKQAVLFVIDSDKFIKLLEYIHTRQKDTLYLPINNKNLIDKVIARAKNLNSPIKDKFIYWDAKLIETVTDMRKFATHVELNKYLSEVPHDQRPDIILSTRASYRGVSLPNLTDILFVENSNFRNVPQSVGRTMRSEFPNVWIPVETGENNILFKAMALKRIKIMNSTYPNLIREYINFDKLGTDNNKGVNNV